MSRRASDICPVVIDQQEKKPWTFDEKTTSVATCHLPEGDYTVEGLRDKVIIERKSLADFVGSISAGRERFFREVERLQPYQYKYIVVEASLDDVAKHRYRSKMHPASVVGTAIALTVDHGLPVLWLDSHEYAARYAEGLLRRIWLKHGVTNGASESDSASGDGNERA